MERKTIVCRRSEVDNLEVCPRLENPMLINIRGCNGSGKSTIPLSMHSKSSIVLTMDGHDVATYFPSYRIVAMGTYRNKTGGLDTFGNNDITKKVLSALWDNASYHILMEGVISSTIKGFYKELFTELNEVMKLKRQVNIMLLTPPAEVCIERVLRRNGGKDIDQELIKDKWRTVDRQYNFFKDAGFNIWKADNSGISVDDTLNWFFAEMQEHGVNL